MLAIGRENELDCYLQAFFQTWDWALRLAGHDPLEALWVVASPTLDADGRLTVNFETGLSQDDLAIFMDGEGLDNIGNVLGVRIEADLPNMCLYLTRPEWAFVGTGTTVAAH